MRSLGDEPNLGCLWGRLIVEELLRHGVDCFVVCPGSRSTPLARAVARLEVRPRTIDRRTFVDERTAAFFALGWGRAGGLAAVITTSGTAAANLLPAVLEADLDGVPLVALTADRPAELRAAGANQTLDQVGLYGRAVRWQADLPAPDDRTPARYLLTAVGQAVRRARGGFGGPVHLNVALREPLAPTPEPYDRRCLEGLERWAAAGEPFTVQATPPTCAVGTVEAIHAARALRAGADGLIVAAAPDLEPEWLEPASRLLGWPVYPDLRSGLRLGPAEPWILPHADLLLGAPWRPRHVLQLGARPISGRLLGYLAAAPPEVWVVVAPTPERIDPAHRVTHRFEADVAHGLEALIEECIAVGPRPPRAPAPAAAAAHARVERALAAELDAPERASEAAVARWLTRHAEEGHGIFASNSLPVRHLQRYGVVGGPTIEVRANRGASGIDGVLATAAGYAAQREISGQGPTTLLIGDLALLHDLGTLAALGAAALPLAVVVLNNGGGGIFSALPVAAHPEVLTPWVQTPHALRFGAVAAALGVAHRETETLADFAAAMAEAWDRPNPSLVEVRSGLAENEAERRRLEQAVARALGAGAP